jgi:hypothetical protein
MIIFYFLFPCFIFRDFDDIFKSETEKRFTLFSFHATLDLIEVFVILLPNLPIKERTIILCSPYHNYLDSIGLLGVHYSSFVIEVRERYANEYK